MNETCLQTRWGRMRSGSHDQDDVKSSALHLRDLWKSSGAGVCGGALFRIDCAKPFPCVTGDATVGGMSGAPVELRVGGQTYRVVASADEQELRRLADIVDTKLRELTAPGRQISPQALLLAALALAHDLEEERERRVTVEQRWREKLTSMLQRIDAAIDATAVVERRVEAEAEAPSHDS